MQAADITEEIAALFAKKVFMVINKVRARILINHNILQCIELIRSGSGTKQTH